MKITNQLFDAFIRCKFKFHLLATGHKGVTAEYGQLLEDLDRKYRQEAILRLQQQSSASQVVNNPASIVDAQTEGSELMLDVALANDQFSVDSVVLKKIADDGRLGRPAYAPMLFFQREKISRWDKLRIAFHALGLFDVLGDMPAFGIIIHGRSGKASKVNFKTPAGVTAIITDARRVVSELARQIEGKPPALTLNDHCTVCEFRDRCNADAREKDDISLLRSLPVGEIENYRERGVFTVQQLSYTFRTKSVIGKRNVKAVRHLSALQALSIREGKIYVVRDPALPAGQPKVFLDVEGIPDRDFYYLVGVAVVENGQTTTHSFWANDSEGERTIWRDLLMLLSGMGKFKIYHYGSYDRRFLDDMAQRYGDLSKLESLAQRLKSDTVDVLTAITGNVYFPAYSRSLKAIGAVLGAKWSDPSASGIRSMVWRREWERTGNPAFKESLVQYNREDCLALKLVTDKLETIARGAAGDALEIVHAQDLPADRDRRFGPVNAAIPEIDQIIKCAYFKYQMTKVFFRTDKAVRKSLRRNKVRRRTLKINKLIECRRSPRRKCPRCRMGPNYRRDTKTVYRRIYYDLRFTGSGIRRWVVCHESNRYVCQFCGSSTTASQYPSSRVKVGHGLASWAIHAHIVLKQSFRDVTAGINDIFGYSFVTQILNTIKHRFARKYAKTQEQLLAKLRASHVLYVDETRVSLRRKPAYVWAFTNLHEVLYLWSLSRDGTVLDGVLRGFDGVLVSDFYGVYDSPSCAQQKCVVHFIRDLNDDLMRAPQDAELADLAKGFTALFTPIIGTIDRFGLKRRYLAKHGPPADRFLKQLAGRTYQSKIAAGYQRRLAKSGTRLFTFLSHDGVSWNNNAAENAIKVFASRRRVMGSTFTENGIGDYLLFLSIYATLRRKGVSFLKFLQSAETDMDKFA
ncbi:MAG: TM0106 family RecB-like putative nuclease [Tepidisphaeraceae bacterium]